VTVWRFVRGEKKKYGPRETLSASGASGGRCPCECGAKAESGKVGKEGPSIGPERVRGVKLRRCGQGGPCKHMGEKLAAKYRSGRKKACTGNEKPGGTQ